MSAVRSAAPGGTARPALILLDIEGTVSPFAYVHEVMFPYARAHIPAFLTARWAESATQDALALMAADAGHANLAAWSPTPATVIAEVERLMAADVKAPGLKRLQGLVWERGFRDGALRAPLFDDVPPALTAWRAAGHDLRIYSSGSVHAQRLFFGHTTHGDFTAFFSAYYDATLGPKRAAASYALIAHAAARPPAEILFLSDLVEELDAARAAGMETTLLLRPGNKPAPAHVHPTATTFAAFI